MLVNTAFAPHQTPPARDTDARRTQPSTAPPSAPPSVGRSSRRHSPVLHPRRPPPPSLPPTPTPPATRRSGAPRPSARAPPARQPPPTFTYPRTLDGCIHKAAGGCLYDECHSLNGCETGKAKITCGYDLPAKFYLAIYLPGDATRDNSWEQYFAAVCIIFNGLGGDSSATETDPDGGVVLKTQHACRDEDEDLTLQRRARIRYDDARAAGLTARSYSQRYPVAERQATERGMADSGPPRGIVGVRSRGA
ncbi:hypothetical protein CRUP_037651 [Coryphaenoides rupestris]|nr:hypothetical protein CRUP_037651 [Coryphaenoides rupestris]